MDDVSRSMAVSVKSRHKRTVASWRFCRRHGKVTEEDWRAMVRDAVDAATSIGEVYRSNTLRKGGPPLVVAFVDELVSKHRKVNENATET